MCGIAGFVGINNRSLLLKMLNIIRHRGPDHTGYYFKNNIGAGSVRLSIIDTSSKGHQPIYNEKKTIFTVYNGEIYNFHELKENLIAKGHKFYSNTDTEVIVHLYEEYGTDFVNHFNGMFGIALFDLVKKKLILVRDRLGIKPLYYRQLPKGLLFSSETKSMLYFEKPPLDRKALDNYLTYRYVTDNERTMFEGINKLLPGEMLIYNFENYTLKKKFYWKLEDSLTNLNLNRHEKYEYFYDLLRDSVKKRLISDVPLGAFLSSGVDSSLIVAIMSSFSNQPVKTFSIGFGTDIDETQDVKWFTDRIGTDHYQLGVDKEDISLLEKITWYFDEPLGDAIIIPMYMLSRFARKKVKVVLTGEGADEIFSGYIHHFALYYGTKANRFMPGPLKKIFFYILKNTPVKLLNHFFPYPAFLGESGKQKLLQYFQKIDDIQNSYFSLTTLFSPEEKKQLYSQDFQDERLPSGIDKNIRSIHQMDDVPLYDIKHWMADNILFKQDRTSMAVSLESRVPYLDHRIVEFMMSLSLDEKIKAFTSKAFLRKVSGKVLPRQISQRPKKAFYIPIDKIFGKQFYSLLKDTLSKQNIVKRNIFNYTGIKSVLDEFNKSSKEVLYTKQLMALFILELWFQNYVDKEFT
ncbi:MAG: asparagine synthase (glutamine-hydrolyzing) [Spirochaetes bacterium]|nr:asparagine synthase (glutamine-hydrolyzing) [Spirochaetota bacterium]